MFEATTDLMFEKIMVIQDKLGDYEIETTDVYSSGDIIIINENRVFVRNKQDYSEQPFNSLPDYLIKEILLEKEDLTCLNLD